jgi:hypothetical protein
MIDVRSRVHRILKSLAGFRDLQERSEWPAALDPKPVLSASETALGIYTDEPTNFSDAIVFTTQGLHVRREKSWLQILYSDIERAIPPASKTGVTGFGILRRDGTEVWLPVTGSKGGRFYDAFEVLRFVNRVKDDVTSAP